MAKKRILVDGYNLALERGTGIATYARNLTYGLKELGHEVDVLYGLKLPGPDQPMAREMAFFDPGSRPRSRWLVRSERLRFAASSWITRKAKPVPKTGLVIDTQFKTRLPHFDRLLNVNDLFVNAVAAHQYLKLNTRIKIADPSPDVAHWTCPLPIRAEGARNIYTIHDLVPMRLPFTTLDLNHRFVQLMRWIVRTADHIVTVSETSKRDIVNLLGVPEHRITNTYQAVDIPEAYLHKPEEDVAREVKGLFGLDYRKYFLFFGAIEPKKNLGRLIEGYLATGLEDPLVVLGEEAWLSENDLRLLNGEHVEHLSRLIRTGDATQVKRHVRRFGYAPFPVLISLIRGARAVVAPSLYEGFGLPTLEAMLCGTPVISSKEGASAEIAGDGALLVDPYNPGEIRDAMLALSSNADLAGALVEKGRRRAAWFSPERYRGNIEALYAKL